ncbi:MAG: M23 family metallopeptidase, partial [Alphaproteobacteria bacterium]
SVHVTSPGVVTFVGWKGGFGKFVEVDHGLGIRTRYAHLSNIYVKRGQTLEFREKVGQIGSTGRSSGEHLHYEVIVDGRSQDPSSFIKAGQYVFKK